MLINIEKKKKVYLEKKWFPMLLILFDIKTLLKIESKYPI